MSSFQKLSLFMLLVLSVTACSSTKSSDDINYRSSEITPTLEIPPDLISSKNNRNLALPGSKVGLASNSGRYVETGNLNIELRTLPVFENVIIQGQGDLHWLSINEKAEKVYPRIRDFWFEQGFVLTLDEPAVGVMETQWLSEKSGSDSFFASLLESLTGAESKHMYKTRFERSDDNSSTLVFLVHRGQELILEEQTDSPNARTERSSGWQLAPSDPAKEYEMLSRLMIHLGMQNDIVKAELEKIGLFNARAVIEYDEDDEQTYLVVKQGFEQTWNRLVHQLDRQGIMFFERTKRDDSGTVSLNAETLSDSTLQPNEAATDKIKLALKGSVNSNVTRIDVLSKGGALDSSPRAKKILQYLFQQLK